MFQRFAHDLPASHSVAFRRDDGLCLSFRFHNRCRHLGRCYFRVASGLRENLKEIGACDALSARTAKYCPQVTEQESFSMAMKQEPPQLDFHLWPPKFSARGTVAIVVAAALTALWLVLSARA